MLAVLAKSYAVFTARGVAATPPLAAAVSLSIESDNFTWPYFELVPFPYVVPVEAWDFGAFPLTAVLISSNSAIVISTETSSLPSNWNAPAASPVKVIVLFSRS